MIERQRIAEGVYYTRLRGSFKSNRVVVALKSPLMRDNITETALLPYLLERGCRRFPDMTALKRRLNHLYGANLFTGSSCFDFARTLTVSIEGADGAFLPGSRRLDYERARLLAEIVCDPALEGGVFPDRLVDIEREKLREDIESYINNKRFYCLKTALESFFSADERALPTRGLAEDLDGVGGARLFEVYSSLLACSEVEIIDTRSGGQELGHVFADCFKGRSPAPIKGPAAVPYRECERRELRMEVEQDKLAIIYTAGRLLDEREQTALRVASALFGGAPTSRLFKNVREKQSLCYYCMSRAGLMTGSLTVDSGVEHINAEKTEQAIAEQLDSLCSDGVTDNELSEIKLYMKNAFAAIGNTPDSLCDWYLNSVMRFGRPVPPEEELERVMAVTAGEVSQVLSLMKPASVCLLTDRGEAK